MKDGGVRLWPWALGIALAVVAVWLVVTMTTREAPPEPELGPRPEPGAAVERPGEQPGLSSPDRRPAGGAAAEEVLSRAEEMRRAVRRYEEECSAGLARAPSGGLEGMISECVGRLNAALDVIVATDTVGEVAIGDRIDEHRRQVARLRSTPPGEQRVDPTLAVFRSAAEVLETVARERYPRSVDADSALADMRAAVERLTPGRGLAEQQDAVHRYFLAAGAILSAMARPGDPGGTP